MFFPNKMIKKGKDKVKMKEENKLIKYGYPEKYSSEIIYIKKPKKQMTPILKILLILFVIGTVIFVTNKFKAPIIRFIGGLTNAEDSSISTSASDNVSSSSEVESSSPTEDTGYNNGGFPIYALNGSGKGFINETSKNYEVSKEDFKLITPTHIYAQYGKDAPVVLIIHSMANEAYSNGKSYTQGQGFYSETDNVASIGEVIIDVLDSQNINAIHINKIFNSSVNSSKNEYEKALKETLAAYPSITYVIDISRDVKINKDLSMPKHIFESELGSCAQIKITTGSDFLYKNDFTNDNLAFAYALQNNIEENMTDLIRTGSISPFPLSQNIAKNFIKVYIGSFSNSYTEAENAAILFSEQLSNFLNNNAE